MRFLLALLPLVAMVAAQQDVDVNNDMTMNLDDRDFDTSGAIRSKQQFQQSIPLQQQQTQKFQAPVQQQRIQLPVQQQTYELPSNIQAPVQQQVQVQQPMMKQQIKESTIMLQPILLMPKQQSKARKSLNLNIDRAMAYRVSPKVSSENSRSVDISFSPILNAKMRNVMLSGEEESHEKLGFIQTAPLLSSKQYQVKGAPVQYRALAPMQQTWASGLQDMSEYEVPSSLSSSIYGTPSRFGSSNEQFEFVNEQPISPRSYTYANTYTQDVEQPQRFQSTYGTPVDSSVLLSSIDETLPSVPLTENNIASLGIAAPVKLNQMLKMCMSLNVNSPICAKVINGAKLLKNHQVAAQVFDNITL